MWTLLILLCYFSVAAGVLHLYLRTWAKELAEYRSFGGEDLGTLVVFALLWPISIFFFTFRNFSASEWFKRTYYAKYGKKGTPECQTNPTSE